ncbi:von Willebrand factor C and EGF domain-containing protein-like [Haliotis rubra]|uniref:von Willebrand factor C and EGF domain-containing protein-like n=1 Tax=Haliotis rubra TaxID=36100 RepID=UPI001EE59353|nr:von Willebrand factor C and EGF domain-containing protein-like [Haliotis rubra]
MAATISPTSALSVMILIATLLAAPSSGKSCYKRDYDAISIILDGTTWDRRCHNCTCVDGDIVCDGPTCTNKYRPEFEYMCTKWSEGGCCCEHEGCVVEGVTVDLDTWYPTRDNPCVECKCVVGHRPCRSNEICVAKIPVAVLD